jgi:hypothetical protein
MSVIDSRQGGPTYFFSSQLGSWKPDGGPRIIARTINFDYPPSPDVARLDYTLSLAQDRTHVSGTVTLTTFPLENGNPLEGEGTLIGTFTLDGELIRP